MTNVEDVVDDLIPTRPPPQGSRQRTAHIWPAQGVAHLDYHDPDHVFQVTVTRVPRRRLSVPDGPVCEIDGVEVGLVEVVIGNHVLVSIEGLPGPVHDQALEDYQIAHERWAREVAANGLDGNTPPPWPGDRLQGRPQLSDDRGTVYRLERGRSGGAGAEWSSDAVFYPIPPPEARILRLDFSTTGSADAQVTLILK